MTRTTLSVAALLTCLLTAASAQAVQTTAEAAGAVDLESSLSTSIQRVAAAQPVRNWMHEDIAGAWAAGFTGKGATITVVDDFKSSSRFYGNLGLGLKNLRHGQWTSLEAHMVAPKATMTARDFHTGTTVKLAKKRLNILNLSYGMYGTTGYTADQIAWSAQEVSIINYARNGQAVIAKAAGNDSVAVDQGTRRGTQDYLDLALVGTQSAIFVGALSDNGSVTAPASMASYSNFAGSNPTVQSQFLVVGVDSSDTGMYGTSFAAPIVSGYAAILASKFNGATPTQITNQLLNTAREDTLSNYDPAIYGQGEASLSRALAPLHIN
ncbi:S8 family serine peptidase [Phaeovulum sp. W22_SRMD_FR3]|uniref:S8 family serine peptidase n=1 Tax=Phaeovulum sp. W22_SRMD_FR3 TaxID=3240274 RepID=UPI003F9552E5